MSRRFRVLWRKARAKCLTKTNKRFGGDESRLAEVFSAM